jgi:hypothetical protein
MRPNQRLHCAVNQRQTTNKKIRDTVRKALINSLLSTQVEESLVWGVDAVFIPLTLALSRRERGLILWVMNQSELP